jgi:hypothetical protein
VEFAMSFWGTLVGLAVGIFTVVAVYFQAGDMHIAVVFFGIAIAAAFTFALSGTRDPEDGLRTKDTDNEGG